MKQILKYIAGILLMIAGAKTQLIGWENQNINAFNFFIFLVIGFALNLTGVMLILNTFIYKK
jgi:hypothetical protein